MSNLSDCYLKRKDWPELWATLERINWHYGRGDVKRVVVITDVPVTGSIRIQKQFGEEQPSFKVSHDRRKVTFRGKTRLIRSHESAHARWASATKRVRP